MESPQPLLRMVGDLLKVNSSVIQRLGGGEQLNAAYRFCEAFSLCETGEIGLDKEARDEACQAGDASCDQLNNAGEESCYGCDHFGVPSKE